MLRLNEETAHLTSLNVRAEHHGDETMTGIDLKFQIRLSAADLHIFDEKLAATLFMVEGDQKDLLDPEALQRLRLPGLKSIKWDLDLAGQRVVVDLGHDDYRVILAKCKVNKFELSPATGGYADTTFRVQCNPDEADIGRLSSWLDQDVYLSIGDANDDDSARQGELNPDAAD